MNRKQLIHHLAVQYFGVTSMEVRNRDSLDIYETSITAIEAALKAAYDLGLEEGRVLVVPQAAPAEPRSKLIYVEATKDTLEIFPVLQGQIEVRMREGEYIDAVDEVLFIPVAFKDNVEWLYDHCSTWRLATFRKLGEELTTM